MDLDKLVEGPLVGVPTILDLLTLSRSCVHVQQQLEVLPPFGKLGPRTARWPVSVLAALLSNRMQIREGLTHLRQPVVLPNWTEWWLPNPPLDAGFGNDLSDLQLLRLHEVAELVGISVPSVYRFIRDKGFPAPLPLTQNARRWIRWEVVDWLRSSIAVSMRLSGALPPLRRKGRTPSSGSEDYPRS